MRYLVYIGSNGIRFEEEDFQLLLPSVDAWMRQHRVTGLLLRINDSLIHYLEGNELMLEEAFQYLNMQYATINAMRLLDGDLDKAIFQKWEMGFRTSKVEEMKEVTGFKNINDNSLLFSELDNVQHPALDLVKAIYESNASPILN